MPVAEEIAARKSFPVCLRKYSPDLLFNQLAICYQDQVADQQYLHNDKDDLPDKLVFGQVLRRSPAYTDFHQVISTISG
jgi:hypothetical protein